MEATWGKNAFAQKKCYRTVHIKRGEYTFVELKSSSVVTRIERTVEGAGRNGRVGDLFVVVQVNMCLL